MKILYVITSSDLGGAPRHLLYLAKWFHDHEHDVTVAAGEPGPFIDKLKKMGIKTKIIPISKQIELRNDWRAFYKLRAFIQKEQFDVVHCHSSKAGIVGRLAAFFAKAPSILFTAHGFVFTDPSLSKKKRNFYILLEKMCASVSSNIITVSHFDYEQGKASGLKAAKLHVVPNGISEAITLSETEWSQRAKRLQNSSKQIVGLVGRLVSEKNIDMFIRVASLFKQENSLNIEFWIVGGGPLQSKYEQQVKEKGVERLVYFKGNQTNVLEWMDQMHLLLITSHKEGMPYVLLEGLARGVAVISTDVGGVKEVLDPENKRGVIVPVNDDQAMFKKVKELLSNKQKREQMELESLQIARQNSVNKMCERTYKVYQH